MKICISLLALLLVACSGSSSGIDSGAPPPGNVDAGPHGADAGPPAPGVDSGSIPQTDAGVSSGFDAGDVPFDAGGGGTDAGGAGMSTSGGDPRADYVGCGETSCMDPQVCCVGLSGAMCTGADGCSGGFSAAGTCDGPEDCDGAGSCCVHFGMFDPMNGAFCRADGCPSGDNELCHSDADCGGGTCVACVPPTGGVLDVTYGICSADGRCPSPYTMAP